MSQPNAFLPTWPPRRDAFDDLPEFGQARAMFDKQLSALGRLAGRAMDPHSADEVKALSEELAAMLHDVGGTAAYFGRADLGTFASELEEPVRAAPSAESLRPLCASIIKRVATADHD